MRILLELWDTLIAKIVAGILAPILAGVVYLLFRRTYRAFRALHYAEDALRAVNRKQLENGLWTEGPGFWLKQPIQRPANYGDLKGNSIPILMIGATKGGVGKTSLAGSLAAYFATQWTQRRQDPDADRPLRVLVIDQDFQGSFSTLTVNVDNRYVQPSKANRLVSGELADGGVRQEGRPSRKAECARTCPFGPSQPTTTWPKPRIGCSSSGCCHCQSNDLSLGSCAYSAWLKRSHQDRERTCAICSLRPFFIQKFRLRSI